MTFCDIFYLEVPTSSCILSIIDDITTHFMESCEGNEVFETVWTSSHDAQCGKKALCHMQTAKVKMSMAIRAV